ncbi:hypothetical protein K438DRAFT_1736800 [Mycena galopus ATCC 62051]|nr:hypothetical protein K438DRAFT_1736800 [Mycena galopus ATCC 62051]
MSTGTRTQERSTAPESPRTQPLASIPAPAVDFRTEMADIDNQIAWHYAQIALLKAKRNAIAPIRKLPNELMIRILTIFAVESNTLFDLKWTKLMYVCHHWHSLALAAQPLWAFIDIQWRGGFSRMFQQLQRSGAAPLALKMSLDHPYYADTILDHSERIRDLELGGEAKHVYELIADLPGAKFPILSSLSLDASYNREKVPEDLDKGLPEAIFDGRLPNLRELTLKSITFPWTSLSGGLTTLILIQCNDSSTTLSPTLHGLLDMLGSCPQLRTLKLELIIPPPVPDQLYATVDLSALVSLSLRDPVISCEMLLNHLRIPPAAAIQLLLHSASTGADIRGILVPLRKHLRALGARKPVLLKILRHSTSYCTLSLFGGTIPRELFDSDAAHCPLSLNCHPYSEGALRQILVKVLKAVPSESITHIDARDAFHVGVVTWRTVIMLLPALETIYLQVYTDTVDSLGAVHCLHALTQIETRNEQHRYQTPPRVRRIHILLVRLKKGRNLTSLSEGRDITSLSEALKEYFQARHANGHGLETLELDDRSYLWSGQEGALDGFFLLMKGDILWNGVVYDPVERKARLAEVRAEREALMAKCGFEI